MIPRAGPDTTGWCLDTISTTTTKGQLNVQTPGFGALLDSWRETATVAREQLSDVRTAEIIERMAGELESQMRAVAGEVLTVQQAARESGHCEESVRRMVRLNPALNAGRKGKPLIRRADLPRKAARKIAGNKAQPYDVRADARSLLEADRRFTANG